MRYGLVLSLLVFGGCATVVPPPVTTDQARVAKSGPCVPPGAPPFAAWRPGRAEIVAVEDEDGRVFPAVRRAYRMPEGSQAIGLWIEGRLVLVDPAPDNAATPAWADRGALAEGRGIALRRDRHARPPCQWQKAGGAAP